MLLKAVYNIQVMGIFWTSWALIRNIVHCCVCLSEIMLSFWFQSWKNSLLCGLTWTLSLRSIIQVHNTTKNAHLKCCFSVAQHKLMSINPRSTLVLRMPFQHISELNAINLALACFCRKLLPSYGIFSSLTLFVFSFRDFTLWIPRRAGKLNFIWDLGQTRRRGIIR